MSAQRKAEKAEVYAAPVETAAPTVEEKRRKRKAVESQPEGAEPEGAEVRKKKKKKKVTE